MAIVETFHMCESDGFRGKPEVFPTRHQVCASSPVYCVVGVPPVGMPRLSTIEMSWPKPAIRYAPLVFLAFAWKYLAPQTWLTLAAGFSLGWLSHRLRLVIFPFSDSHDVGRLYNLEHGMLNLELPCKTMWMNMGYWKVDTLSGLFPRQSQDTDAITGHGLLSCCVCRFT